VNSSKDALKLAVRYRSWDTQDLVRATTVEAEEYTPEAIRLIRQELQERDLTPEVEETVESQVVVEAKKEQRSLTGIRGWLLVFVVLFGLNSGARLLAEIFALGQALPGIVKLDIIVEMFISIYALSTCWLLLSRHPKAPQHAKAAVVIFCFFAVGSWLAFYWGGLPAGPFPLSASSFACIWWSYLSYSKRVRFTYAPGTEDVVEAEVAQ